MELEEKGHRRKIVERRILITSSDPRYRAITHAQLDALVELLHTKEGDR